jgi:hypothetical protein
MQELSQQSRLDYRSAYYDPPRVPWWFLLILFLLLGGIASLLPDSLIWMIVVDLLWGFWCIYLGFWLRRLDPNSTALFWILACTALDLARTIVRTTIDAKESLLPAFAGLAYVVVLCIRIFVVRAELERHYNRRENISLKLGPFMTLFFSFVYFQYHLYYIAEARVREREDLRTSV